MAGEIRTICGDALEEMAKLPDGCVDMVLCDLPYGTTACKWDSIIPLAPLWEQYQRICKGAFLLNAAQPFTSILVCSNLSEFKYDWVWDKVNRYTNFLHCKKMPLRRHESVLLFGNPFVYNEQVILKRRMGGGPKNTNGDVYNSSAKRAGYTESLELVPHHPHSILSFPAIGNRDPKGLHPTQKPIDLYSYLIRTYTNPGMTVLDCCSGSGTTGVSCVETDRNAILIERDPTYYQIGVDRIAAAQKAKHDQPSLF